MRIRRNASKILGSASLAYAANPNRPSTPATAPGAEAEDFTVCELNCSPWDLMATDPNSPYCDFLIANLKGEEEEEEEEGEDEGILGNTITTDEPEHIASAAAELTLREMKEIEEKKLVKRRRIGKGKEKDAAVAYCKKTDGKGWHCKRQAQLPNSLCGYHLAQIKAYSSNHRAVLADPPSSVADGGRCSSSYHRKRKAAGEEATDKDYSGFYYYYGGFGPWRGKRRGRPIPAGSGAGALNSCGGHNAKVKEDSSSKESTVLDNGDDDDDDGGNDNAIAGDDEYDLDRSEELDGHRGSCTTTPHREQEGTCSVAKKGGLERKKVAKKRGRKPFKCRSLKSLL